MKRLCSLGMEKESAQSLILALCVVGIVLLWGALVRPGAMGRTGSADGGSAGPSGPAMPESLRAEHREIRAELQKAIWDSGPVGEAARAMEQALRPHFEKEEKFALPPLVLLPRLAAGEMAPDMADIIPLTDRLRAELPQMVREHQAIAEGLDRLAAAAREEGRPEYERFAERLRLHALAEEEIFYPAAVLAGEYVKARLERQSRN